MNRWAVHCSNFNRFGSRAPLQPPGGGYGELSTRIIENILMRLLDPVIYGVEHNGTQLIESTFDRRYGVSSFS